MTVLEDLLSRIFRSLENFFQKATELDVFDDFVFSYKIKLISVEKCSSQFLSIFAEFHNELQSAVKEYTYLSDKEWKFNHDQHVVELVQNENVTIADEQHSLIQPSQLHEERIDETLVVIPVQVVDKSSSVEIVLTNSNKESLRNHHPHQTEPHSDSELIVNDLDKFRDDLPVIDCANQNKVTIIADGKNNMCLISNEKSISKCSFCFRKFRTLVKLTKHACKKRNKKQSNRQVTITNSETNDTRNVSVNVNESITSFDDENNKLLPVTKLNDDAPTARQIPVHSTSQSVETTQPDLLQQQDNVNPLQNEEPNLPVYSCALCCITFLELSRWNDHVCKEREGNARYKREIVATRDLLEERHWFVCGFCSETYRSLGRIMYHLVRCFAGPYLCEVCVNSFTTRSELNYHKKKQHKGVESFFCDQCGLGFKLRTSLQKHLINRHENIQGEYHCDISGCREVFPKKIFLTHHKINEHRMERKYLCQVCGNKFYNPCSLSSHLETHSDKKKFPCPICCRVLKTKEKLTLHVRTHTGERPFSCTICSKSFIAKSKLEEHSRRHRGEKRHKCSNSNCGKLYANGFDLKQHVKKCNRKIVINKPSENLSTITVTSKLNIMAPPLQKTKSQQSLAEDQQATSVQPPTSRQPHDVQRKGDSPLRQSQSQPANEMDNITITNTATSNRAASSASSNGSGMIIQLDSNGRVVPLQTTAVHLVDYVPYYPPPDPIHIVMPPQTLVLTGYDNITY